MRTVTLTGTEVVTSKLGFGCSALIGGRSRTEALRLLEAAYDSGIRHFDVARLYGTGDAEDVLGEFATRRRSNITIATKFGISPTPSTLGTGIAKSLVRFAARRSRRALHLARRYGRWTIRRRGQFTPDAAITSLVASLTKLRTEYIDVLLLHDCTAADWHSQALLSTLEEVVSRGQARVIGTATSFRTSEEIFAGAMPHPSIVQFEDDMLLNNLPSFRGIARDAAVITHGTFRNLLSALCQRLIHDPDLTATWKQRLDVDVSRPEIVAGLLLSYSLHANSDGVVLFSSGDPARIAANARIASEIAFEQAQLYEFARLVREALRSNEPADIAGRNKGIR